MSKDIRSFFSVVSKKSGSSTAPSFPSKKRAVIHSSDEDIIADSPIPPKREIKHKKRKVNIIDSDSDDDHKKKKQSSSKLESKKESLKLVNINDVFGTSPIKQSKVIERIIESPKKEEKKPKKRSKNKKDSKNHGDDDFEKTLLELDEDFPVDIADLDKTIDEALQDVNKKLENHQREEKSKEKDKNDEKIKTEEKIKKDEKIKREEKVKKEKIRDETKSNEKIKEEELKEEIEKSNGDHKMEKSQRKSSSSSEVKTPARKRKIEEDLNDSGMDPDQERHERKRHSAILYQKYLSRGGPINLGKKILPKGKNDCLRNVTFVRTGVLDSLDRDALDALLKEHGGRIVGGISRKVNYLLVGEDPGPAKIEKAKSMGIKEITEDELLDMILVRSGMPAKYVKKDDDFEDDIKKKHEIKKKDDDFEDDIKKKHEIKIEKSPKKENEVKKEKISPKSSSAPNLKKLKKDKDEIPAVTYKSDLKKIKTDDDEIPAVTVRKDSKSSNKSSKSSKHNQFKAAQSSASNDVVQEHPKLTHSQNLEQIDRKPIIISQNNQSWTEKYKPKDIKSIIGQQGDKSNMKKLMIWLQNWHKNHSGKNRPKLTKPSPWAKSDDGAYFKCALLSGSPGLGKTTTATLVAKELGFDIVEFNASDTRSKRLLKEEVGQLLSTTSIASFLKDGSAPTTKHVLLMDEVDGMAGNEDRGGMQELINLIKQSNVPIICMCNDRNHQKVRSLANYCLDLRFVKPKLEQIRGAMMSICYKEGLKISSETISQVINGAGMDIRQILNNLSMWTSAEKNLSSEVAKKESTASKKDTVIGPWEVIRKVFSEEDHKNMTVSDKSRLFFYDYSIGPLFVQENYLQVVPHCSKDKILERLALTADSLSMSDVIDKKIRSTNNWSLLESQAMYASVLPGHYFEGHFGGQINFPGWLGKNSKRTKFQRLLSELQAHMRTSMSGSKLSVNMDYIYHLRNKIVRPLAKEGTAGVEKALEVLRSYNLLREDLDSILELSQWSKQKDPMAMVESKVKAALTRAYNKQGPCLPYATNTTAVKKRTPASSQESEIYGDEDEQEVSDNDDENDIGKDAMIKQAKKKAPAKGVKKDSSEASTSKKASAKPRTKKTK